MMRKQGICGYPTNIYKQCNNGHIYENVSIDPQITSIYLNTNRRRRIYREQQNMKSDNHPRNNKKKGRIIVFDTATTSEIMIMT